MYRYSFISNDALIQTLYIFGFICDDKCVIFYLGEVAVTSNNWKCHRNGFIKEFLSTSFIHIKFVSYFLLNQKYQHLT